MAGHSANTKSNSSLLHSQSGSGGRVAILAVVISLVFVTLGAREPTSTVFTGAREIFSVITMPLQYVGAVVTYPLRAVAGFTQDASATSESISKLKEENESLKAQNIELTEYKKTAETLQGLLSLKSSYNLQSVAARVISYSTDTWSNTVTLDKGTTSGLSEGMPVCDANAVIGQIIESGPTSSVVRLITDENSSISAMIQINRAQGMLKGSADGTLWLTLIGTDQSVAVGDAVVTSGLGGVFPKGLPVGTVSNVTKVSGALYQQITVEPLSKPQTFEEVLVITSLTEGQQASAQDISQADAQDSNANAAQTQTQTQEQTDTASSTSTQAEQ